MIGRGTEEKKKRVDEANKLKTQMSLVCQSGCFMRKGYIYIYIYIYIIFIFLRTQKSFSTENAINNVLKRTRSGIFM